MNYNLTLEVDTYGSIFSWWLKIENELISPFDYYDSTKDVWVKKLPNFPIKDKLDIELYCKGVSGSYIKLDIRVNEKKKIKKEIKAVAGYNPMPVIVKIEINDDNLIHIKKN